MTVYYETKFNPSGDLTNIGHIRVLNASGKDCCSGDTPENFCTLCKAQVEKDFANLEKGTVAPQVYFHIPSTGELVRRPERTLKVASKVAAKPKPKPMTASERLLSKAVPMEPKPSTQAPPPPTILDVVRSKVKALVSTTPKVNSSGVPNAPNLFDNLRSKK